MARNIHGFLYDGYSFDQERAMKDKRSLLTKRHTAALRGKKKLKRH